MKVLVVGHGLIGAQRTRSLALQDDVCEVVVIDPNLPSNAPLPRKSRIAVMGEALKDHYGAAIVSTPHDTAVALLPDIARVSSFILVEKPLGRTTQEALSLAKAAKSEGASLFVGLNYRFLRNVRHAKQILDSGEFGRILALDGILAHGAEPGYERSWKTDAARCGGGACLDPGIHLIDLLEWLAGPSKVVSSALSTTYWPIAVEDHANVCLRIGGGALSTLSFSISSWASRFELSIEMERAQLLLRGRGRYYGSQRLTLITKWPWLNQTAPREKTWDYGADDTSLHDETLAFLSLAAGKTAETKPASAAEAVQAIRHIDACYGRLIMDSTQGAAK